jgi:YidC/Oxa1 family membrane protein insertase
MEQRNLLLALLLSLAILISFQLLYPPEPPVAPAEPGPTSAAETAGPPPSTPGAVTPPTTVMPGAPVPEVAVERAEVVARTSRVAIETPRVRGSLSLRGARIDDLWLQDYKETQEPESPQVLLLSPSGSPKPYFGEFGWIPAESSVAVPGPGTVWTADRDILVPDAPVTMTWDNGAGLSFVRTVSVDSDYLFTVTQRVENSGPQAVTLFPYGRVVRLGTPDTLGYFILHEGPIGVFDGTLSEYSYDDLLDDGAIPVSSTGGWIGITDKFWLVALIPDQAEPFDGQFRHSLTSDDQYQVDYRRGGVVVNSGGSVEVSNRLFAGAKEVRTVERYRDELGVQRFDLAIDWGWFFFLTKPIFLSIDFLYRYSGNFGVAIVVFTLFIRLLFYPLANKSFRSFGAMRRVQPELTRIREVYKDDRERMSKEMMDLYKKEGVNPLSGCMPLLLQIPVFFALYKTLFVTIEMRHAPFFGWIRDLSAPDPTNLFNLFGLIPWDPPGFIHIGIWPLLMGFSMYVQMKLNPAPPDPIQQKIFAFLPVVFTVILAPFPAGLVIYWTVNNVLSMAQQWYIMQRVGRPQVPSAGGG